MTTVRQIAARVQPGLGVGVRGSPTQPQNSDRAESFADALRRAQGPEGPKVKFSAHALDRIRDRGITVGPQEHLAINGAITTLESKGAKDALLLNNDSAFLVNVPNRTVITALDRAELANRMFTNIDSALLLE